MPILNWSRRDLAHFFSDDSDSSDEDDFLSRVKAYQAIDIRKGLLTPKHYCNAANELERIILGLYRDKRLSKETKKLIENDAQTAINECTFGDLQSRALQALMSAIEKQFPQAKRQNLLREYKQRILHHKRSQRRRKSKAHNSSDNEDERIDKLAMNLPKECLEIAFSHLDPISLATAAATCTLWRDVAYDNSFWKPLAKRTFSENLVDLAATAADVSNEVISYRNLFTEFASENPEWLLPWRTDRITCHGVVRWISLETRQRIMVTDFISYNKTMELAFMTPEEVAVWILKQHPQFLKNIVTDRKNRSERTFRRLRNHYLAQLNAVPQEQLRDISENEDGDSSATSSEGSGSTHSRLIETLRINTRIL